MTNWKKDALAAVIITAAGLAYIKISHRSVTPDLRRAAADKTSVVEFEKQSVNDSGIKLVSGIPAPVAGKGYAEGNDAAVALLGTQISWVTINGGTFTMGTDDDVSGVEDAKPVHQVAIKTFDMSKTAVTVEQYAECVNKGLCTEPGTGGYCNWKVAGHQLHPVNCVNWDQANQYARFKGARLPSESEWEYAAKSGGKNQKYPWGNEEATCDRAVMHGYGGSGCGKDSTWPVCSKPDGNTAQGLCDMAGNIWQWVQDKYRDSYKGAPADGSAFEGGGADAERVMRGGSFGSGGARFLRADHRDIVAPGGRGDGIGFRIARSSH